MHTRASTHTQIYVHTHTHTQAYRAYSLSSRAGNTEATGTAKTSNRMSQAQFHWPPYAAYGPGRSQNSVLTLLKGIGDPLFSNTLLHRALIKGKWKNNVPAKSLPIGMHTHIPIYTLVFSSYFGFQHNSFTWKKANCILRRKAEKNVACPSALALTPQVELGLNEYRAGQPRVCTGPFFPEQNWKQRHLCQRQPHCNTSNPTTNKA